MQINYDPGINYISNFTAVCQKIIEFVGIYYYWINLLEGHDAASNPEYSVIAN